MENYNIDKLLLDFFKNKPIVSFFSFIFLFFYVGLTVFFPKYSGSFISKINSLNKKKFIHELLILGCIYLILWLGVCLHYYIMHGMLLKHSRPFFFKQIFVPLWDKVEKGNLKQNSTTKILKNILNLVITSTQTIQGLIFITLPLFFSFIVFLINTPNIFEVKFVIILTFLLLGYLLYKFSNKIKIKSGERLQKTNEIVDLIEDDINNNLNIINFNTLKKELIFFKKNCKEQESKCYKSGITQVIFTNLFVLIIVIGLIIPVFLCYRKQNLIEYKIFISTYIPMVISIIIVCYTSLTRVISFIQTYGDQQKNVEIINSYIIKEKSDNNNYHNKNKNLNLVNISLSFGNNNIFKNVNIQFNKGITLLKGNSGGGKSCILKMIFGILSHEKGDVFYNNISKNNSKIQKWRDNIFYLNQFPLFFNNRKIEENIYYGNCEQTNCNVQQINRVINKFGLSQEFSYLLKNSNTYSLSGGEKQLISIIKSFSIDKDIYLFDEPTASLDSDKKNIIYKIIKELRKNDKIIIVVSHDQNFEKMSDTILDIEKIKMNII